MQKIDKNNQIPFLLVEELAKNDNFESSFNMVTKKLKFTKKQSDKIFSTTFKNKYDSLNFELNLLLNKLLEKSKRPKNFPQFRLNEKVKFFILKRIEITNKNLDLRKLIRINFKKKSPTKFVRTLFNISDEIWYLTGDKSTDFNFYSKRFILMNIYLNSLIYFLVSKENDFSKLEIFVEKQIRAVQLFGKLKRIFKNFVNTK